MARIGLILPYQSSLTVLVWRILSFSSHLALVYLVLSPVLHGHTFHAAQGLGFEDELSAGSQGAQR